MPIPETVARYLRERRVAFRELPHPPTETLKQAAAAADVPFGRIARTVILKGSKRMLMAVLPAAHILDIQALCRQLDCDLEPEIGRAHV